MKRYYVEYHPVADKELTSFIYLYAYSSAQINSMMADYKLVAVDQIDWSKITSIKEGQLWLPFFYAQIPEIGGNGFLWVTVCKTAKVTQWALYRLSGAIIDTLQSVCINN